MNLSIAVAGAGALGTFYGARILKAGYHTEFYSPSSPQETKNISIQSIWENFRIGADFFGNTNQMKKADIVIITTKSLPGVAYRDILKPLVHENSILFLLQNGIGEEEKIAELFPHNALIGGVAFTCVTRNSPEEIEHTDYGAIKAAAWNEQSRGALSTIESVFTAARIPFFPVESLVQMRWEKLLWNIPFNSLSVLFRADTAQMMNNAASRNLAEMLMRETLQIAVADGAALEEKHVLQKMEETQKMAPYKTSMLLDFLNNRPLEIETILGEPLRRAGQHGVAAPHLETVYMILQFPLR